MVDRISSLDDGYTTGDLSVYPEAIDDKETLYEAKNNAVTLLKKSLTYNGKHIIVDDTSKFPNQGLIRLGPLPGVAGSAELIYYDKKTKNSFTNLIRGFAGSRQNYWRAEESWITNAVMAEHHNAVKDATLNIETNVGLSVNPSSDSLNGILKSLENRFLAPKPFFNAFPLEGQHPLNVRFQSRSEGDVIRHLWDFGDGTTSVEEHPHHTYQSEGIYTVRLSIITSSGAQGIATKSNYITVSENLSEPFFYVTLADDSQPAYSQQTASSENDRLGLVPSDPDYILPATFIFVDQTSGNISQRFWIFDDGDSSTITDPDIHTVQHIYDAPGTYNPSLLIVLQTQELRRVFLAEEITVI